MHRLAVAALFLLAVTGCGGKARPTDVHELRGTYRGVGIGDTTAEVERVFGHESLSGYEEPIAPRKEDFVDIAARRSSPAVAAPSCATTMSPSSFATTVSTVSSSRRAERTRHEGSQSGDDAKKAGARYPQLTCGESPFEGGSYPYCGRTDRSTPLAVVRPRPDPQHHGRHRPSPHLGCRPKRAT